MASKNQQFDVRRDGTFVLHDNLYIDYRQQQVSILVRRLIKLKGRLTRVIGRSLANDNRLIGQEKATIATILLSLIRTMASLHLKLLDPRYAAEYSENPRVYFGSDGFAIEGKINPAAFTTHFSIEAWNKNYLEGAITVFLKQFEAVLADKELKAKEKIQLAYTLNPVLIETIQAFYLVRSFGIFT
ncbi:MAG: hypothetical protein LDLANPLL_02511 [Turneriella sp.]|nr:hypothetical protein [Turneriella sp.]